MKKLLTVSLLGIMFVSGCTSNTDNSETPSQQQGCSGDEEAAVCGVGNAADMSDYEGFDEKDNQFIAIPLTDAIQKLETDASGIFYFGFPSCPWCIEAVPVMNEVAKANNQKIYYIDKKAETSDEESIKKIEKMLEKFLPKDDNGNPKLYVPEVIVVKDGEVLANHSNTVEGHNARERKMTQEEVAELKNTYTDLFQKLK